LVAARARLTPDGLFLVDEAGQRVTFGEFDARVTRVAAALAAAGVTVGTRVAWQLPTRISTCLVMAALRRLGAVQSPIIPLYREREVSAALATADAQVLVVPSTWRGFDFTALAARIAAAGGPAPRVVEIGYEGARGRACRRPGRAGAGPFRIPDRLTGPCWWQPDRRRYETAASDSPTPATPCPSTSGQAGRRRSTLRAVPSGCRERPRCRALPQWLPPRPPRPLVRR